MSNFICPVCGIELSAGGKSLFCKNNHHFDIAKSGYVNLLQNRCTRTNLHGDGKLMIRARRSFLDKGYYRPLLHNIIAIIREHAHTGCTILDAGCGECWYTANIHDYLVQNHINHEIFGVDISKDAVDAGAKRCHGLKLAVASVNSLPIQSCSCDIVLSVFAPCYGMEFSRVLNDAGIVIKVIPLEKHLWSLKQAVYETPYENKPEFDNLDGLELIKKDEIREIIHLACSEDIINVFAMTPYYYNTRPEDIEKLKKLSELDTQIEFGILVYRKKQ